MTDSEYNELIDLLHYGHELDFWYNGIRYFLEKLSDSEYELYDITDENNGILLRKIIVRNGDLVATVLNEPVFDGKSINEIYSYIVNYYIE